VVVPDVEVSVVVPLVVVVAKVPDSETVNVVEPLVVVVRKVVAGEVVVNVVVSLVEVVS
jgi:hypothetical protein